MTAVDVLVVGAGMAGLTAALALAEEGHSVRVVDKGRSVGGRLATRRIGSAVADHGAQFFTVRSEMFADAVRMWEADGIVSVWCDGFDASKADGHPRYRTEGGMSQLAKHLAGAVKNAGAEIVVNQRVASLIDTGDGITASYDAGSRYPDDARSVLVTSPVPQSIEMLRTGGVAVPDPALLITYDSVIALLISTDDDVESIVGPNGARQQPLDPMFTFIADNRTKGISPETLLTFHTEPALSAALWNLEDKEILERLQPELGRVLGTVTPTAIQVKKWRYAAPRSGHPERFLSIPTTSAPVILAGDAFGEARVEGAFLSGRHAAAELASRLSI